MSASHVRSSATRTVDQIQENMLAYFRLFVDLPGIMFGSEDVFWFINAKAEPGNHTLRTRLPSSAAERRIDQIIDQIGQYTDHLDWLVFPRCQPGDLGTRLEARGMSGGPGGTWMVADLTSLSILFSTPERFRIAYVRNLELLDRWQRVSAAGFGFDAHIYYNAYARHGFGAEAISLHYIGYLHDEPVTSATLLLAGGIAGIWDVSTAPSFRGQGYGSAITLAMMQEAHARGYQHAWVWSSTLGKRVYSKIGFVAADFGIREYQWKKR
jgi:GNAT superfamily N-acetyltransferase